VITQQIKLGFLASRNGSSARGILTAIAGGNLNAEARLLVSNNKAAPALAMAASHGVAALCIPTQADPQAADARLAQAMADAGVELVVLSGYLRQLGPLMLERFHNRVLNVHPGPLPAFGGQGMYGRHVHEAVLTSGATESGICIHLVDRDYDQGPIVARRDVPINPGDTAETLEARVNALEPDVFVEVLQRIASGDIELPPRNPTGLS
jgi:phosphoribosylglycinamide formyltransferase-1